MPLSDIITAAREYMSPQEAEFLVYHSSCLEGNISAMCAIYNRSDLKMLDYYNIERDISPLIGKKVIFVDCAPNPEQYDTIKQEGGRALVLAHNAPAIAELKDKPGCFSAQEESGASLLWGYFNPDKLQPMLVTLVAKHPRLTPQDLAQYSDQLKLQRIVEEDEQAIALSADEELKLQRIAEEHEQAIASAYNERAIAELASRITLSIDDEFPYIIEPGNGHPKASGATWSESPRALFTPAPKPWIPSGFIITAASLSAIASGAGFVAAVVNITTDPKPWIPSGFVTTAANLSVVGAGAIFAAVAVNATKRRCSSSAP